MTCNMSPCQPQLTKQLPLGPGPSVPGVTTGYPAPRHLITRTRSDGPRSQAWPVWSDQKSAGYCQMMSSKINPVIQSFQSKLRLFESLKTHRDRELSRSCNLVTGSFSSRRIHLVSRSFLRYLAHSGSGCGYCQPQDNVLPMLPRSLRRHQAERVERERGWQWQVPVRQLCDNTELSSAIWFLGN